MSKSVELFENPDTGKSTKLRQILNWYLKNTTVNIYILATKFTEFNEEKDKQIKLVTKDINELKGKLKYENDECVVLAEEGSWYFREYKEEWLTLADNYRIIYTTVKKLKGENENDLDTAIVDIVSKIIKPSKY